MVRDAFLILGVAGFCLVSLTGDAAKNRFTLNTEIFDGMVQKANPNSVYAAGNSMLIGSSSGESSYGHFGFNPSALLPTNAEIERLDYYAVAANVIGTTPTVLDFYHVHAVTNVESSLTWNAQSNYTITNTGYSLDLSDLVLGATVTISDTTQLVPIIQDAYDRGEWVWFQIRANPDPGSGSLSLSVIENVNDYQRPSFVLTYRLKGGLITDVFRLDNGDLRLVSPSRNLNTNGWGFYVASKDGQENVGISSSGNFTHAGAYLDIPCPYDVTSPVNVMIAFHEGVEREVESFAVPSGAIGGGGGGGLAEVDEESLAEAIWAALMEDHDEEGSMGEGIGAILSYVDILPQNSANYPSAADNASAVLDESVVPHYTPGSLGWYTNKIYELGFHNGNLAPLLGDFRILKLARVSAVDGIHQAPVLIQSTDSSPPDVDMSLVELGSEALILHATESSFQSVGGYQIGDYYFYHFLADIPINVTAPFGIIVNATDTSGYHTTEFVELNFVQTGEVNLAGDWMPAEDLELRLDQIERLSFMGGIGDATGYYALEDFDRIQFGIRVPGGSMIAIEKNDPDTGQSTTVIFDYPEALDGRSSSFVVDMGAEQWLAGIGIVDASTTYAGEN